MQVNVTIAGLFVLAYDQLPDVHVLAPRNMLGHVDKHVAAIVPDASTGAPIRIVSGCEIDLTGLATPATLSVATLPILSLPVGASDPTLGVPRAVLGTSRASTVELHVKLSGGRLIAERPICLQKPCGDGTEATFTVLRWVFTLADGPLSIPIVDFAGVPQPPMVLNPSPVSGNIWFALTYGTAVPSSIGDIYGPLGAGTPGHYHLLSQVCDPPTTVVPVDCPSPGPLHVLTFPTICPISMAPLK